MEILSSMASGIAKHIVPAAGVFMEASSNSEWYEHLNSQGSCLCLLDLLIEKRELVHQLGPKGITVLHKGVQHGCVRLVRFILVNMFDDEGSCTCRVHSPEDSRLTREQLLGKACKEGVTAVHMAVMSGSPKMVLLLKWAIDKNELELKKKNSSSKGDHFTLSNATRVSLQRARQRSTGNRSFCSGEEWDMEGEDMRRLFEAGNVDSIPTGNGSFFSGEEWDMDGGDMRRVFEAGNREDFPTELTPTEPCPPAVEDEMSISSTESYDLAVPNVRDNTIDCVYDTDSKESDMIPKVYRLIERTLEALDCFEPDMQEQIQMVKDGCKKSVDFEFVPVAHVFLHHMFSRFTSDEIFDSRDSGKLCLIFGRIMRACSEHDLEEQGNPQGNGSMLATLFKILDPRGRTILHVAIEKYKARTILTLFSRLKSWGLLDAMTTESVKECVNSTDGAGRTILHLMCIRGERMSYGLDKLLVLDFDWDAVLSPLCCEELAALEKWCFPRYEGRVRFGNRVVFAHYRPILLAIIFDSTSAFRKIYSFSKCTRDNMDMSEAFDYDDVPRMALDDPVHQFYKFAPLQVAAFLGRATIVEEILRQQQLRTISIDDAGLQADLHFNDVLPAIHCAALSGQVEAIQSILKFPIYDPIVQHKDPTFPIYSEGTALHLILKRKNFNFFVKSFQTISLFHVLPNSQSSKLHFDEHDPQMFSANEISCINLLLQAGIDVWTPHWNTKELPNPGPMANDKAREWWYNRVVNEVVTQKTSINNAANATSVIATLVATASFIGPLQPPLGLGDDGYIYTSRIAVRVYLVCNGLSFYFSIASILMAVLPAIPMPKESLHDELLRSQRCLKAAALLLLVSIMCILTSFTSASITVVSSERHDKLLVGAYIVVGGAVCVMVLVVYIIRLLRMVFHRHDRFRRWFAKHMIF